MSEHTLHTLWLLLAGNPGTRRTCTLLRAMSPAEAYHADEARLREHLNERDAARFLNKDLTPAIKVAEACREKGIRTVCYHDADYPPQLREIEDPPAVLFCLGNLPEPGMPTMGIVGTRSCSKAAAGLAASFSCSLALSGIQVVSGMANGVDSYVHKGPLIKGYPTFAVLGCGVDVIYPKQNKDLYHILRQHGGLISEYPPGTKPMAGNFPRRNRIISGLSDGVLVIECPPKSGSMSTARHAIEQNRTLFAVPAAANDRINTGTNDLIRNGAVFCAEPQDIFRELSSRYGDKITPTVIRFEHTEAPETDRPAEPPRRPARRRSATPKKEPRPPQDRDVPPPSPSLSPDEALVCNAFAPGETLSPDEICQKTGLPFYRLLPLLQALELTGLIEPAPGSVYRRK